MLKLWGSCYSGSDGREERTSGHYCFTRCCLKAGAAASRRWRNTMYSAFRRRGLADLTGTRQAHDA